MINVQQLNSLLFKFQINQNVFNSFLRRLSKFGAEQDIEFIEAYENYIEQKNRAIKIIKTEDTYVIKIINPLIIPFLIRKIGNPEVTASGKNYIKKLLKDPNFLSRIEELSVHQSEKIWWHFSDFHYLLGIRPFLGLRAELMQNYVSKYQMHTGKGWG
jgi:hypothetical protein